LFRAPVRDGSADPHRRPAQGRARRWLPKPTVTKRANDNWLLVAGKADDRAVIAYLEAEGTPWYGGRAGARCPAARVGATQSTARSGGPRPGGRPKRRAPVPDGRGERSNFTRTIGGGRAVTSFHCRRPRSAHRGPGGPSTENDSAPRSRLFLGSAGFEVVGRTDHFPWLGVVIDRT